MRTAPRVFSYLTFPILALSLVACQDDHSLGPASVASQVVNRGPAGGELARFPELVERIKEVRLDPALFPPEEPDAELIDRVRRADGIVHIGFKSPAAATSRRTGIVPAMSRGEALSYRQMLEARGAVLLQTLRNSSTVFARIPPELAPQLRRLPFVNFLVPESFGMPGQAPPAQDTGWGAKLIGAPWVWYNTSMAGQWATITILDTGVDSVHRWNMSLDGPENLFLDCLYVGTIGDSCYQEGNVHGSHVAGIASARNNDVGVIGIAFNPYQFASVRVCNGAVGCPWSALIVGLDWTTSNGYARQIVNISIQGCAGSPALVEAVARSYGAGNLIVSIAGNTTFSCGGEVGATGVTYPGRYPSVVAVSGSLPNDAFAIPNSPPCTGGSRFGPEVDLAAPFWANSMVENGEWDVFCGTSMAAPVVAGVAAMLWTRNTSWSAFDVWLALCNSAVKGLGDASHFGCGRVSAYNALQPPPPPPPPSLFVSISGADPVPPYATCNYIGGASGGTEPYTFEWSVDGNPAGNGSNVLSWTNSGSGFFVSLSVRDANGVGGASGMSVMVDPNTTSCFDQ